VLVPALAILVHELGHFAAMHAMGFQGVRLSFWSVAVEGPPVAGNLRTADAIAGGAGGLASLGLVAAAALSVALFRANPWALAVCLWESTRAVLGLGSRIVLHGLSFAAVPGAGHLQAFARLAGDSAPLGAVLDAVEILLTLLALAFVASRLGWLRAQILAASAAGVAFGVWLWLAWVGPALLPV
jgi:hypothetical protein